MQEDSWLNDFIDDSRRPRIIDTTCTPIYEGLATKEDLSVINIEDSDIQYFTVDQLQRLF